MAAGVGVIGLLVLVGIGLLLFGGLVLLVMLLTSQKTRMAGVIVLLLIVPVVLGLAGLAGLAFFWLQFPKSRQPSRPPTVEYRYDDLPANERPAPLSEAVPLGTPAVSTEVGPDQRTSGSGGEDR